MFVFLLNDAARRAVVDVNRCFKQDAFFFYLPGLQNKRLHGDAADKQAQVAMHFSPSLPSWLSVELALQDHVNSALLDLSPPLPPPTTRLAAENGLIVCLQFFFKAPPPTRTAALQSGPPPVDGVHCARPGRSFMAAAAASSSSSTRCSCGENQALPQVALQQQHHERRLKLCKHATSVLLRDPISPSAMPVE